MDFSKLKPGMILNVSYTIGNTIVDRNIILLNVTKEDIKKGVQADYPGLHGFYGFWYGRNPTKISSYGKIEGSVDEMQLNILSYKTYTVKHDSLFCLKVNYLKTIL